MRTLAALFLSAITLSLFAGTAGATPPTCESTACTDPIGHLLGPVGDLLKPR